MAEHDEYQEINLRQYLAVVRQKLWIVVLAVLVTVVPTGIMFMRAEPVYEASAKVLIEQGGAPIRALETQAAGIEPEIERILLFSRPVMDSVLRKLDPYYESLSQSKKLARIGQFKKNITIDFNKVKVYKSSESALAEITVEGPDPAKVAEVASLVAQTYIDQTHNREVAEAKSWLDWFGRQLVQMRENVNKAEKKFQDFKLEKGIIGLQERKNELASKLQTTSSAQLQARLDRMNTELALSSLEKALKLGPVAATATFGSYGSAGIADLRSELDKVKMELKEKLGVYRPKHPVILDLKEKIRSLEAQLESREMEIIRTQRNKVQSLEKIDESLSGTLATYKEEVQKLNAMELQYSILEREVTSSKDLYDLLAERQKKSALESAVNRRKISVVESAIVPTAPVSQKLGLKLLVAAIIGLLVGTGLAFLLDYLEMTYKTPEDIERHLGLWVVGVIPRFESGTERALSFANVRAQMARKGGRRERQ
ncbi:MAG TPA: GumC family protein [bacterium]|nr:GumC family protein [bacterium]